MSRFLKFSGIVLLSLFFLVPSASAQFRRGFGYGPRWGGGWGWYGAGWGWYGPYAWGWGYPYYGYGYYGPGGAVGKVKIVDVPKDALVYVDGGYAGTVGKLKEFALRPGNHDIELRDPSGHPFQQEKIDTIAGKTLEIRGTSGGH
jgi:hypothetical protein